MEEQEQDYCGLRRCPLETILRELLKNNLKNYLFRGGNTMVRPSLPYISSTFVEKSILQE